MWNIVFRYDDPDTNEEVKCVIKTHAKTKQEAIRLASCVSQQHTVYKDIK
jgi:hypothetical protein